MLYVYVVFPVLHKQGKLFCNFGGVFHIKILEKEKLKTLREKTLLMAKQRHCTLVNVGQVSFLSLSSQLRYSHYKEHIEIKKYFLERISNKIICFNHIFTVLFTVNHALEYANDFIIQNCST